MASMLFAFNFRCIVAFGWSNRMVCSITQPRHSSIRISDEIFINASSCVSSDEKEHTSVIRHRCLCTSDITAYKALCSLFIRLVVEPTHWCMLVMLAKVLWSASYLCFFPFFFHSFLCCFYWHVAPSYFSTFLPLFFAFLRHFRNTLFFRLVWVLCSRSFVRTYQLITQLN